MLPSLKPIPLKDRVSVVWVERGRLDMLDGAFVEVDKTGVRTHIPVGNVGCIMLEPGSRVSHAAVALAARVRCLLLWVGEGGVRLYAAGQPGGARSDKLLYQAGLALDPRLRLKVVRKMYAMRFDEEPPTSVVGEPFCYPADHAPKDPRAGHHRPPGGGVRWVDRVAGGDELHYRIGGDDGFRDVAVRLD